MRFEVRVKTGKNEIKVIKKEFGRYEVWVKARPVKGAANKELLATLADYFSVKPYKLDIIRGITSPIKIIELKK